MDMSFVADCSSAANTLGISDESLYIVKPVFDTALPPLTPAVFPPQMREPKGSVLELFDLNNIFASKKDRQHPIMYILLIHAYYVFFFFLNRIILFNNFKGNILFFP